LFWYASNPKCADDRVKGSWNQPNQQAHRQRFLLRREDVPCTNELSKSYQLTTIFKPSGIAMLSLPCSREAVISQKAHDLPPQKGEDTVRFQKPTTH